MASESYEVAITPAARDDLREAVAYYRRAAGKTSARKLMDRFDEVVSYLEAIPTAAARVADSEYRWLPVGRFILVYGIDEERKPVTIMRLHYESSNWRAVLENQSNGPA